MKKEYRAVCQAMKDLASKGKNGPLPKDDDLYCRRAAIKKTLE
jgi:hypothetical protein